MHFAYIFLNILFTVFKMYILILDTMMEGPRLYLIF